MATTGKSSRNRTLGTVCLIAFFLATTACQKERYCHTPIGDATCQIEPDSPLYPGLNSIGGFVYLTGGYSGMVVIKIGMDEYVAFERTCPHDSCRLEVHTDTTWYADHSGYRLAPNSSILECPKCGSWFNPYDFGNPYTGYSKTACPLYQYNTFYDGHLLYIRNY